MSNISSSAAGTTAQSSVRGGYAAYGAEPWSDGNTGTPDTQIPSGSTTYTWEPGQRYLSDGLKIRYGTLSTNLNLSITDITVDTVESGTVTVVSGASLSDGTWHEFNFPDATPTAFHVTFQNDASGSIDVTGYDLQPHLEATGSHVHEYGGS